MNDQHDKELSALFASDSEALADEAFVERCVTSFRRRQQRLLLVKLTLLFAAAGILSLLAPILTDLAAIVPSRLSAAFAALSSMFGGLDRAIAIGIALALLVRQYGFRLFRLGGPAN